jgi:hypothetical protein
MEIFKTSASIQAAATHHPDSELRHLLSARIESLADLLDEFVAPYLVAPDLFLTY